MEPGPGHFNNPDMMEIGNARHGLATSGGFSTLAAPVAVGDTIIQVTSSSPRGARRPGPPVHLFVRPPATHRSPLPGAMR